MTYVIILQNVNIISEVDIMSMRKDYEEIATYDICYVDIKTIMNSKNISQNILAKMTRLSINTIRSYYHSDIKRVDLDVLSRICEALNCEPKDIIKLK